MLITFYNLVKLARSHPLTRANPWQVLGRLLRWQISSSLLRAPVIVPWVDSSRLVMAKGMVGATGNYYCGLHEFEDMSFLLHFLHSDDLFLDIGANVGSYTVLAASVRGARVVAIEPIPTTFQHLLDNVNINYIADKTRALNIGLGASSGMLRFSEQLDAENHVLPQADVHQCHGVDVQVRKLDDLLGIERPLMIKIDVEGFETEVLRGGQKVFSSLELQAVLIELNGAGARYGFDENAIFDQFEAWGFHLCRYDPLKRRLRLIDRSEASGYNGLYVRDWEAAQARIEASPSFHVLNRRI